MRGEHLLDALSRFCDASHEPFALTLDRVAEPRAEFGEAFKDEVPARAQVADHMFAGCVKPAVDLLHAIGESARHILGCGADIARHFFSSLGQPVDDVDAMGAERRVEHVAGVLQREPDFFPSGAQRRGDASSRLAHRFGKLHGGIRQLVRKRIPCAKQSGARIVGVVKNRFAFAGQFVNQQTDATLVLRIGALEIGDLRAHDHFEFAGSRQGALNAVAHGSRFASNGLRKRDDLFGRDRFRFDQTDGDFRH